MHKLYNLFKLIMSKIYILKKCIFNDSFILEGHGLDSQYRH